MLFIVISLYTCFRLYASPEDTGENLDVVDWQLSFDWPFTEDDDYLKAETELYSLLDNLLKSK